MDSGFWPAVCGVLTLEAFVAAFALVPVTIVIARRWGWVSAPAGGRHIHRRPVPMLGGMAIAGAVLLVVAGNVLAAFAFGDRVAAHWPGPGRYVLNVPGVLAPLGVVLAGAGVMWVLGVVDDRVALGPRVKLVVMIAAAAIAPLGGVRIEGFLPWPFLGAAATVFWIVLIANAINFLDNMDGLAAGVSAIAAGAFAFLSLLAGEWFMACLHAVLAGALLGFLWHNLSPARLFMGDNGSLFVGYLLGVLSVMGTYYEKGVPTPLPILTPVIVLGLPLFDTVSVLWIRWREKRPLMHGDRSHFSHRLVDLGMSPRRAVTFIYVVAAAVALAAVPLRSLGAGAALALLGQLVLIFWAIYRLERTARRRTEGPDGLA